MNEDKNKQNDWRKEFQERHSRSTPPGGGGSSNKGKFRFSLWYFLLAFLLLSAFNMLFLRRGDDSIPYSEFKALIAAGEIKDVRYTGDVLEGYSFRSSELPADQNFLQALQSTTDERRTVWKTVAINDPTLLPLMEEQGVMFQAESQKSNYFLDLFIRMILPIFLLLIVWRFLMKRMGGLGGSNVMSFGQSNARIVAEMDLVTRFKDVAGCDEAKDELVEIVDFLKSPAKYTQIGGKIPKGALLVGPPGTGKTLLARAVAGEAEVTFFRMSGADFVEMFVGVGAARVRDLFKQACAKAPCIIFIDELDAIGKSRAGSLATNDEREQTLNQLLVEMDGFDSTSGVIILAATNRPEVLDPALLRPGRFDRQVLVDRPDLLGREAILKIHSAGVNMADEVNLKDVARATSGFVGADLANIINEAALLAVRSSREAVSMADLTEAIEKSVVGLEKKNKLLNPREREIVAYHETGHALISAFTPDSDPVHKVSIVPRGLGALGYTLNTPTEDRFLRTTGELIGRVDILLGGRAAEEIAYGQISTGAANDIVKATDIIRDMIAEYGMSERFRNVALVKRGGAVIQGNQITQGREYSEITQQYMDEEIARIMQERYTHVLDRLRKHRGLMETVTTRLMDVEILEAKEFMDLIEADEKGREELNTKKQADMKPSQRAEASGQMRDKAIKIRLKERQDAEEQKQREAEKKEENAASDSEPDAVEAN